MAMTKQVERAEQSEVTPALLAAMRQGEADRQWLDKHPDVLQPYRGQWVVAHRGRVVAHSADGREVAGTASASRYPAALLEYVPTREEAEAMHIYTPVFRAADG